MGWQLAGAALGGFINNRSAKKTNKENRKMAREERDFAHRQGVIAREYQVERETAARVYDDGVAWRNRDWAMADNADVKEQQATQFERLREAAERGGFNPLTALASGHSMVAGPAGGYSAASTSVALGAPHVGTPQGAPAIAPLLSTDALASGFQSVGDMVTGQAALDRAEQQSRIDLNRVNAEAQGALLRGVPRTASVTSGGRATVPPLSAPRWSPGLAPDQWSLGSAFDADRGIEKLPATNAAGVFEIEGDWFGPKPIYLPGDGEPWGADEVATALAFGGPQYLYNRVAGKLANPEPGSIIDRWRKHGGVSVDLNSPPSFVTRTRRAREERMFVPSLGF